MVLREETAHWSLLHVRRCALAVPVRTAGDGDAADRESVQTCKLTLEHPTDGRGHREPHRAVTTRHSLSQQGLSAVDKAFPATLGG